MTASPRIPQGRRRRWPTRAAFSLLLVVSLSGCGKKGPPVPPEPRGPNGPDRLTVRQIGDEISVYFEMPPAKGSRPPQQPSKAELLRVAFAPGFAPPRDPEAFRRRGEIVAEVAAAGLVARAPVRIADPSFKELEGGGLGWTLRYAVRIRDQRGRPSRPVAATDIQPLSPALPPTNLSAEPTADGVRLKWDAPRDLGAAAESGAAAVAGVSSRPDPAAAPPDRPEEPNSDAAVLYNIYRAEQGEPLPQQPLTPAPLTEQDYLDGSIVTGNSYLYVVRVLMAPGTPRREGAGSAPVEILAVDRFAPASPTGLAVVQEGDAIRLFWNPNREPDLAGYRVYRRIGGDDWQRIGADPIELPTLIDPDVRVGQTVAYRVTALDRADEPNESPPTEERELVVAQEPSVPGSPR